MLSPTDRNIVVQDRMLLLDFMKLDRALTPAERAAIFRGGRRKPHNASRPTALPGPDGETCGSCGNLDFNQPGNKRFYKCGLVNWTHGKATDIRKKDSACQQWKAKADKPVLRIIDMGSSETK